MLKVLYIDDGVAADADWLILPAAYQWVAERATAHSLPAIFAREQPDFLLIRSLTLSAALFSSLEQLHLTPKPILLFSTSNERELIRMALSLGVSAYVLNDWRAERLAAELLLGSLRFEEKRHWQAQLQQAQCQLLERKIIDRAKGLLMDKQHMSEQQAFVALRNQAMKQGIKLADAARQVLALASWMDA
ncbi:ANTAR domain-containing response regulator [Deefgea salmonis]|uniref:ANTAR domain-containing protein n=1 Tax=Deefgea salmonis TaxID=2875502 RepID=A0ABS8BNB8_9NEIS|nr:ANTAR domain-containing protein [Deefgea salmonis]MCB5197222.1 ANTAR domain-containing protein [Deefgea salmonis]